MPELKDELAALRIEREPHRRGRGRGVVWLLVPIVLGGAAYASWRWATQARAVEVETATVSERPAGTQAAVLNASGYVTARRRATVSSKITGKVVEVNVEEGMAVKEGQVLARLDDATAQAALALAEAQAEAARRAVRENEVRLAEAKVNLGRAMQLVSDQLTTQAEVDTARAQVDSLDARIAAAREQVRVAERQVELERTNLDNTVIRAPFSGVAISKDAQPGEMVSPVSAGGGFTRTGICTIVDMRSLEIEVDVNESYINRVITTVPAADRQKATVLVRIGFEALDPRILPDMGVKVTFLRTDSAASGAEGGLSGAPPVTLVPKAAIRAEGEQAYAFVVDNGVVDRRAVRTGGMDGDRLEVLAGLRAGERVVLSPPTELASGTQVTVK
jgi:HlyD family secretion protein